MGHRLTEFCSPHPKSARCHSAETALKGGGRLKRISSQRGMTLTELMVVVAIVGILASVAENSYSSFVSRARVTEGLLIAERLKTAVNETYTLDSVIPESNSEAGLPDEASFSSRYVEWARLKRVDGEIRIQVSFSAADPQLAGKRLILVPEETGFGMLKWTCKQAGFGYTLPYDLTPASCRNPYWD